MGYIKPNRNNINFELFSEYVAPIVFNDIQFNLTPDSGDTSSANVFEGSVSIGEVPMEGTTINLYKRSTGELVDSTVTTDTGTFNIPWTDTDEYYYMVALYPTIEHNALIYDYLYPTVSGS